ncbi:MAG: hypothetical protein HN377_04035 [Alphaproteobacteria bacterium]|jgi:hypothetical protein|nr:hypothetical protein [Alphaproteobacteria bacterium]
MDPVRTANLTYQGPRLKIVRIRERRYRFGMYRAPAIPSAVVLAALLLATACAGPNQSDRAEDKNAFVYNQREFDRTTFTKPTVIPDSITVCYNKFGTTQATIANIAAEECRKFNKTAEFNRLSLLVCPLFTPVAAIYNCVGDKR